MSHTYSRPIMIGKLRSVAPARTLRGELPQPRAQVSIRVSPPGSVALRETGLADSRQTRLSDMPDAATACRPLRVNLPGAAAFPPALLVSRRSGAPPSVQCSRGPDFPKRSTLHCTASERAALWARER